MWNFVPIDKPGPSESGIPVPYFEEARADYAPYYRSRMSEANAKAEVINELNKLGGSRVKFVAGYFTREKQKRYGFTIYFLARGVESVIR